MSNAVTVTDQSFDAEVLRSGVPVLVDFWAEWCGPCKAIGPIVDELAGEFAGRLKVAKVDVDANIEVSSRYNVMSIPTLLLFKGGEVVDRLVGAAPKPALVSRLQKHLE